MSSWALSAQTQLMPPQGTAIHRICLSQSKKLNGCFPKSVCFGELLLNIEIIGVKPSSTEVLAAGFLTNWNSAPFCKGIEIILAQGGQECGVLGLEC